MRTQPLQPQVVPRLSLGNDALVQWTRVVCGTYIDSTIVSEKVWIGTLPAHTGTTNRAERMGNTLLAERVIGHGVESADPCDVRLKRVDHEITIGRANGTYGGARVVSYLRWR